jgi:hypothetical protein
MTVKTYAEKLMKIDRRILYLLLFISVFYIIMNPIGLPIQINPASRALVATIKALPDGSTVFFSSDFSTQGKVEVFPECIAAVRLLIQKKVNIVFASFIVAEGALWPPQVLQVLSKEVDAANYKYGVNYVFLGYYPGGETSVAAFSSNIRSIATTDYYNTPIDQIPLMKDLNKITDFKLAIVTGSAGLGTMITQMQTPYKMPMVFMTMGVDYVAVVKYYTSKEILGLTSGLQGAAEMELILGTPGAGAASMDALSVSHLLVVFLVILGNIGYFKINWRKK